MLDMGFEPQIRSIVEEADMPAGRRRHGGGGGEGGEGGEGGGGYYGEEEGEAEGEAAGRQTVMFSATFPKAVRGIANSFLVDPLMLKVGRVGGAALSVTQKVVFVAGRDKTDETVELLQAVPGKTIVFVNTKRAADTLEAELSACGHPAASVHGDKDRSALFSQPPSLAVSVPSLARLCPPPCPLPTPVSPPPSPSPLPHHAPPLAPPQDQRARERALGDFKSGRINVLVGTDVLGRGIDVPEVTHVINYDAPDDIEDYTHRIGEASSTLPRHFLDTS